MNAKEISVGIMKLKNKLRVLIIISTIFFVIVGGSLTNYINHGKNLQVEEVLFQENMEETLRKLNNELKDLETIVIDWAEWDAMYNLLDQFDQEFINENFVDDVYELFNIDYVILANDEDEVLYSGYYNGETITEVSENRMLEFLLFQGESGMLKSDEGPMMFISKPLNNSESSNIPKGSLTFVRKMDESYQKQLQYDLNVEFEVYFDEKTIVATQESEHGIVASLAHLEGQYSTMRIEVPFLNSEDGMIMDFQLENRVQNLAHEYNVINVTMITVIILLIGVVLDLSLKYAIVDRVVDLNKQIKKIKFLENTSERIEYDGEDEIAELSGSINEMLEQIESMHEKVLLYANFDEMTGTHSRKKGFMMLQEDFSSASSGALTLSLVYIDMDNLKTINDMYGHAMGDSLIADAAMLMKNVIPKNSYIIRVGGDEFLMVLREKNYQEAQLIVQSLKKQIIDFNDVSQKVYKVSLSSGIASYSDEKHLKELIEKADSEMYALKNERK